MKLHITHSILKRFIRLIFLLSLVACGGSDDPVPSKKDEVKNILTSAMWKLQSVTVDGTDRTEVYKDMTLRFTSSNYSTTNAVPVWKANGTWTFTDEAATAFVRDDDVEVSIMLATENSLKLGLVWDETTLGSGRIGSVAGEHVFTFVK